MPTIQKREHGYVILSRRHGRFVTHQLTPDGAKKVQTRLGVQDINGVGVDVATLIELKRSEDAYMTAPGFAQRAARAFKFVIPRPLQVPLLLIVAGTFATVCAISLVVGLTWYSDTVPSFVWVGCISGAFALAAGFGALRVHCHKCRAGTAIKLPCQRMFLQYQNGVGFALLFLGIVNVFVFAGLAHRLLFDSATTYPVDNLTKEQQFAIAATCSLRIVLSLNMAVLGALFFIANSLRKLRICRRSFDSSVFWAGLWYRIGEAVLFTLVFLLVIHWRYKGDLLKTSAEYDLMLPLLALVLGMFIKTGERLVFGTAERIFAAASAMLPVQPEVLDSRSQRENPPHGAAPAKSANGETVPPSFISAATQSATDPSTVQP
jgi:hypothetical protein